MASTSYTQDMPPKGGYAPLQWERVHLKRLLSSNKILAIAGALGVVGWTAYYFAYKKHFLEELEIRSARHVILPLYLAERDRAMLKQLRKNRDEERELMKDVEDWEVGTYYGEPVYRTLEGKIISIDFVEYQAHADPMLGLYRQFRQHVMM